MSDRHKCKQQLPLLPQARRKLGFIITHGESPELYEDKVKQIIRAIKKYIREAA